MLIFGNILALMAGIVDVGARRLVVKKQMQSGKGQAFRYCLKGKQTMAGHFGAHCLLVCVPGSCLPSMKPPSCRRSYQVAGTVELALAFLEAVARAKGKMF